jgi:cholesterol transport system auxiliary component
MKKATFFVALLPLAFSGCGGLLDSKVAAPQTYVLRLPVNAPAADGSRAGSNGGTVLVQRPEAGPGLDSNRIALLRSDRRFDFFAASLWAAPAPDVVESALVDAMRGSGVFSAVFDDASPFAPRYDLRCVMRRFEADYTDGGNAGAGAAPMINVVLDCTLGRRRDRVLLASFTAQGAIRAGEDRLNSIVAAFEAATSAAMNDLTASVTAALQAEEPKVP